MEFVRIIEIVFLAAFLIFFIIFYPVTMVGAYGNWLRWLKAAAEKYNGEYVGGFNHGFRHFLKIPSEGGIVTLGFNNIQWGQRGPPCLKAAGLPLSAAFYITNRKIISILLNISVPHLKNISSRRDVDLGDIAFKRSFVVLSDNEELMRRLLTRDVREKLLKINKYDAYLSLENGEFKYISSRFRWSEQSLDEYIDTGLMIVRRLKEIFARYSCK